MANPDAATLSRLAELLIAGRLRVPIERTYELSEVPAALGDFAATKSGTS